jgi:enamine deaminase RidA (YjgF/YER057c/UK114 family)
MATHERMNPPGLFDAGVMSYSQVMRSRGATFIQVAGQAALGTDLQVLAPGDFAGQVAAALANLRIALAAAGATPADVNLVRIYVVGHRADYVAVLQGALRGFFGDTLPPGTLVGVAALAMPELLVEIEATAIV